MSQAAGGDRIGPGGPAHPGCCCRGEPDRRSDAGGDGDGADGVGRAGPAARVRRSRRAPTARSGARTVVSSTSSPTGPRPGSRAGSTTSVPTRVGRSRSTRARVPVVPSSNVVDGTVNASAPDGKGGYYLAGDFSRVSDVRRQGLVHIKADGSVDRSWPASSVTTTVTVKGVTKSQTGSVKSIAVAGDRLIIGGDFDTVNGVRSSRLAAIGLDGNVISTWQASASATVNALAVVGSQGLRRWLVHQPQRRQPCLPLPGSAGRWRHRPDVHGADERSGLRPGRPGRRHQRPGHREARW